MVSCGGGLECVREVPRGLEGQEVLVSVCVCRWGETVLAVGKHVLGIAGGETAGLGLDIKENGVQFPPAQGLDGYLVDTRDEQGGCAPRAE